MKRGREKDKKLFFLILYNMHLFHIQIIVQKYEIKVYLQFNQIRELLYQDINIFNKILYSPHIKFITRDQFITNYIQFVIFF